MDTENQFYKVSVVSVKYRLSIGLYRLGGHLKNIRFASPDQLLLWTKKTSKFGSENWIIPILQFLKISELCLKGKKCNKHLPPI